MLGDKNNKLFFTELYLRMIHLTLAVSGISLHHPEVFKQILFESIILLLAHS